MYIITNRRIDERDSGASILGPTPNERGSNELRLVEARPRGRGWSLDVLPDVISDEQKAEVGLENEANPVYASAYAARKLVAQARDEGKNILVFVHGYNNDIQAILNRARTLEENYDVLVVCFSWPARGGGVRGTMSYRQDKRDAKASIAAFERFLLIARRNLDEINSGAKERAMRDALDAHPDDNEKLAIKFQELMDRACPIKISMMLHSMGNYLMKHTIKSSTSEGIGCLFDNVALIAADTNNRSHSEWVDRIRVREAVYIVINENDTALRASETKIGDAQRARLGRTRRNLDSIQGIYIDVTGAPHVGRSHAYFGDRAAEPGSGGGKLRKMFQRMFNGERCEEDLEFDPGIGAYRLPSRRR